MRIIENKEQMRIRLKAYREHMKKSGWKQYAFWAPAPCIDEVQVVIKKWKKKCPLGDAPEISLPPKPDLILVNGEWVIKTGTKE